MGAALAVFLAVAGLVTANLRGVGYRFVTRHRWSCPTSCALTHRTLKPWSAHQASVRRASQVVAVAGVGHVVAPGL